jgi:endonuclease-8
VPEGDSLYRMAAMLRPVLLGKAVIELALPRTELGFAHRVAGTIVTAVESRGKNLLIHFDGGVVLHTHLRMTGTWHLYPDGRPWRRSEAMAVAILRVEGFTAVCFAAPVVRVLRERALPIDRRLSRLGPDLLSPDFDADEALRRLRALDDEPIGIAIMDQQAVAGIGNVYKSEILFMRRLDPFAPVRSLRDEQLREVLALGVELLRRNVRGSDRIAETRRWPYGPIRTTRAGADQGKGPVHVYGRAGRPCFVCGATIRMEHQGALRRSTYFCPECQSVPLATDDLEQPPSDGAAPDGRDWKEIEV